MAKIQSLEDVFVDQIKDLYSAETQITKALPKMAKAAASPQLKKGFEFHLKQTKEHVARLEGICEELEVKPTGKKCQATSGLIREGKEAMAEKATPEMKDILLTAAARRIEHYEIAGYTSAMALAKGLGQAKVLRLLSQTLAEEEATDQKLASASDAAITKAAR